jgi:flagellar motor switch protein FliN/FliY
MSDDPNDPAAAQAPPHGEKELNLDEVPAPGDYSVAAEDEERSAASLAPVYDVPVSIQAVLGKTHLDVAALLRLARGSVIELDRKVGEAIDIFVNNRLVARGEVVVVDDRLGVTMTEIIKDSEAS